MCHLQIKLFIFIKLVQKNCSRKLKVRRCWTAYRKIWQLSDTFICVFVLQIGFGCIGLSVKVRNDIADLIRNLVRVTELGFTSSLCCTKNLGLIFTSETTYLFALSSILARFNRVCAAKKRDQLSLPSSVLVQGGISQQSKSTLFIFRREYSIGYFSDAPEY